MIPLKSSFRAGLALLAFAAAQAASAAPAPARPMALSPDLALSPVGTPIPGDELGRLQRPAADGAAREGRRLGAGLDAQPAALLPAGDRRHAPGQPQAPCCIEF